MSSSHSLLPSAVTLPKLALAGVIGQLSFEAYAWLMSPVLFGPSLQPSNLVKALTLMGTGITLPYFAAFILHFVIGSGFVVAVWALHRLFGLRWIASGVLAGFALWFVAQGMLAPLIGRSFMMDFGAYTQSSFVGHVGMTTIMALVLKHLTTQSAPTAAA